MVVSKRVAAERRLARRLQYFDSKYLAQPGVRLLAGVDEVGRGALAGPVVVGAVVVDASCRFAGVNDSKQLDEARREEVSRVIRAKALDYAIGWATAEEIDRINIYQATLLAARRALGALRLKPDLVLADALRLEGLDVRVEPLIKGDARSQVIAAASVIAKVTRDNWMRLLDREYPGYGFSAHKGYAVQAHQEAIRQQGASTIHRHTFAGVEWFDQCYRASRTLEDLLKREETLEGEIEEVWLGCGHLLPECELQLLRDAWAEKRRAETKRQDTSNDSSPLPSLPDAGAGEQAFKASS